MCQGGADSGIDANEIIIFTIMFVSLNLKDWNVSMVTEVNN